MKHKMTGWLTTVASVIILSAVCRADIKPENVARGKYYDFSRMPEKITPDTGRILTDGVKAGDKGTNCLEWTGNEEVVITVDLVNQCMIYSAKLDIAGAKEVRGYISRNNAGYEELPTRQIGNEVMIGGVKTVKGQFLKIVAVPAGVLRCSELEATGNEISLLAEDSVPTEIGLKLWQAATANLPAATNSHPLPEGVSWDISKAYSEETPTRKRISLNGVWKIQPVKDGGRFPPVSNWEYSYLPFVLQGGSASEFTGSGCSIYDNKMKILATWNGLRPVDFVNVWWKREFEAPSDLRGRRLCLKIDHIGHYGRVYLNGKLLGEGYNNRENRFDINDIVCWDRPNELKIFASVGKKSQRFFSRQNAVESRPGGVVGNIWLESFPTQACIKTTQIIPSTRKKNLRIALDIAGKGNFKVSGEIYDKSGKVAELPEQKVIVNGERVECVYPWEDAEFWSVDNPRLYWLSVSLKDMQGKVVDQTTRQRFGFREFWIEGGDYYLNGKRTFLCMNTSPCVISANLYNEEWLAGYFREMKKLGFNSVRYFVFPYEEKILKVADEVGLLVILDAAEIAWTGLFETDVTKGLDSWETWSRSAKLQRQTRDDMKELVARFGNHPSMAMWMMTFNSMDHTWTMNPYALDGSYDPYLSKSDSVGFANKLKIDVALKLESLLYEYDLSRRPIFHNSCGNIGQAITANAYFNFGFPKQEWEDWPMFWSRVKPKPLINVEDNYPVFPAWMGLGGYDFDSREMFFVEYAAMYLGDDSYRQVTPLWLHLQRMQAKLNNYYIGEGEWRNYLIARTPQAMKIGSLLVKDVVRAWRTYGISGIGPFAIDHMLFEEPIGGGVVKYPVPDPDPQYAWLTSWQSVNVLTRFAGNTDMDPTLPGPRDPNVVGLRWGQTNRPTEFYHAMQKAFDRVLAYLGGAGDDFTAKDHAYFSGETAAKQFIILNDSEQDLSGEVSVRLRGEGINEVVKAVTVKVKAGEQERVPLQCIMPVVKQRTDYDLEAVLKVGALEYKDVLQLTAFPREKIECKSKILLLDDVGITEKVLREAGVAFDKIENVPDPSIYRVLAIGREYGKKGGIPEAVRLNLEKALTNGMVIVVFEQPKAPDDLFRINHNDTSFMGLKLREGSYCYTFMRDKRHPLLEGLEPSDLINWRGESDMMEPYPKPDLIDENRYPERFWKMGNKGIVSTYAIEKPSKGTFRVIADAGFDLSDAVLLEWLEGKNRIVFCQMDVSGRYGKDPVATKIIHNILKYTQAEPRQAREALYIGGERGVKLLETAGVKYRSLAQKDPLLSGAALIIGDMDQAQISGRAEEIKSFIKGGGMALFLPVGTNEPYAMAVCPPGLAFQKQKICMLSDRSLKMDSLRGLGIGDFYLRNDLPRAARGYEAVVAKNLPPESQGTEPAVVAEAPYGKGTCIFFGLNLLPFEKQYPYEKVIRDWNTLLANLGVDSRNSMLGNGALTLYTQRCKGVNLAGTWKFKTDPPNNGLEQGWQKTEYDDSAWKLLKVPGYWEDQGITEANPNWKPVHEQCGNCSSNYYYNGYAWYRKHVVIPENSKGNSMVLEIRAIDDNDWTYVNGILVGKMGEDVPNAYCSQRKYRISSSAIRYGQDNVIAVRVYDLHGAGGFVGNPVRILPLPPANQTDFYIEKYINFNPYCFHRW